MSDPSKQIAVRPRGLTKRYGQVTAVDGIDLDIREGELLTLLGPSGSGKTTTLRMVAGFELPTEGTIHLAGSTSPTGRRSSATSTPSSRTTPCSRT
jgi:putative spermidine/putrescine transport system ATP-binding protein